MPTLAAQFQKHRPLRARCLAACLRAGLFSGTLKMSRRARARPNRAAGWVASENEDAYRSVRFGAGASAAAETYSFSRLVYCSFACSIWICRSCSCSAQADQSSSGSPARCKSRFGIGRPVLLTSDNHAGWADKLPSAVAPSLASQIVSTYTTKCKETKKKRLHLAKITIG